MTTIPMTSVIPGRARPRADHRLWELGGDSSAWSGAVEMGSTEEVLRVSGRQMCKERFQRKREQ